MNFIYMNRDELIKSFENEIFAYKSFDSDEIFLRNLMEDVDEYVESTIDPFQVKQLDENIINITDLLVIGEGFAKTFVRAKQIATMFNVTSKYMFGDFEVLVRENSRFDDIKKLYLEFLYDNNNQF